MTGYDEVTLEQVALLPCWRPHQGRDLEVRGDTAGGGTGPGEAADAGRIPPEPAAGAPPYRHRISDLLLHEDGESVRVCGPLPQEPRETAGNQDTSGFQGEGSGAAQGWRKMGVPGEVPRGPVLG